MAINDGKSLVLAAVDIVQLIGQTVALKKRGRDFVGLCPFHQEKSPSFKVDPTKNFFYCFGCKAAGNAIDFVMRRDKVDFVEALKSLAEAYHVELPKFGVSKEKSAQRSSLIEAGKIAAAFFRRQLLDPANPMAATAREYLQKRGFTEETLDKFQVGLAPDGWETLLRSPDMRKFPPDVLVQAGLVQARAQGTGYFDHFRRRIMFPIRDTSGQPIGFGGRVLPGTDDNPKYKNSPDTLLFNKSRTVYGIDLAADKIRKTQTVAIVEGYTDVVMAHQYGCSNVVSVLGTALTEQHVQILRRFADRIVLLFDGDNAGDLAVNRAVELFLTQPVEIGIATLPDGMDPDEFVMQRGSDAFDALLASATDALEYQWVRLRKSVDAAGGSLTAEQHAIEAYLALLASARGSQNVDPLRWGGALTRVSKLTGIPVEQLQQRFRATPVKRTSAAASSGQFQNTSNGVDGRYGPASPQSTQAGPEAAGMAASEMAPAAGFTQSAAADVKAGRWVLGVVLADPARWSTVQVHVQPEDLLDEIQRKLAAIVWEHQREEGDIEFASLLGSLDEPLKQLAVEVVDEVEQLKDIEQTLSAALLYYEEKRVRQQERKLETDLRRTSRESRNEDNEVAALAALQELKKHRPSDLRRFGASR